MGLLTEIGKLKMELSGMSLKRGGEVPLVPLWVTFESIAWDEVASIGVYWDDNLRFVDDAEPFSASWRMVFKLTSTELSIIDLSKLFSKELGLAACVCKPNTNVHIHRYGLAVNRVLVICRDGQMESQSTCSLMAT